MGTLEWEPCAFANILSRLGCVGVHSRTENVVGLATILPKSFGTAPGLHLHVSATCVYCLTIQVRGTNSPLDALPPEPHSCHGCPGRRTRAVSFKMTDLSVMQLLMSSVFETRRNNAVLDSILHQFGRAFQVQLFHGAVLVKRDRTRGKVEN